MIRKLFLLIILIATCIYEPVYGEVKDGKVSLTGGVKSEVNLSQYLLVPTGMSSYMGVGSTLGGFVMVDIASGFSIEGELLFHYKNTFVGKHSYERIRSISMEIPIYAMYNYRCKDNSYVRVGIGPYCEFGLSAITWKDGVIRDLYDVNKRDEIQSMNDSHTGFGIVVGYETSFGLQLNVGYKISVTNLLDANSNRWAIYPMGVSMGLGYRFGR